jgi:hypothetical protein
VPLQIDVYLNRLAQELDSERGGLQWFGQLADNEQREVLSRLWLFSAQAGARECDVDAAIARAKLKATFTPCVLLKGGRLKVQVAKVLNLPHVEYGKSFRLFLALFKIADERRRRTDCQNGCSHWWHAMVT